MVTPGAQARRSTGERLHVNETTGESLPALLSRVLVPLIWELEAEQPEPASAAVWADCLRVLPQRGATLREISRLAHVSPRSTKVLAQAAERAGLTGGTDTAVRRTPSGDRASQAW